MLGIVGRRGVVLSLSLFACTARVPGDAGDEGEVQLAGIDDREGEACDDYFQERACGEEGLGAQFCDWPVDSQGFEWGPCLAVSELACEPEANDCEDGDSHFCMLDDGVPVPTECFTESGDTPLVLVPPGAELRFEAAGTSTFAIAGECITHDWPSAATPWLAIDLDRSGSIDGGHELFGSGTVLATGARAHDGFAALAELDADGDGAITPADPRFAELVLWSDHDGDRRSTHWEHTSLAAAGIPAIPLAYAEDRTCDGRGNCAIEHTPVAVHAGGMTLAATIVDVHLACQ